MLSSALAQILHADIGDTVSVEVLEGRRKRLDLPIAAIFDTYIGTTAYMDLAALTHAIGEPDTVNALLLRVDPSRRDALFERLKSLPTLGGAVVKAAAIDVFNDTMGETLLIYVSFYVFFSATLAIGVVYNNLRIALSERGRELATLRVLGFRTGEITYLLFGEAALLVLLALPIGALLGWGLTSLMAASFATELFRVPVVVQSGHVRICRARRDRLRRRLCGAGAATPAAARPDSRPENPGVNSMRWQPTTTKRLLFWAVPGHGTARVPGGCVAR